MALTAIHPDKFAGVAQGAEVLHALNGKTLEQERRARPGPIQFTDVHAQLQLGDRQSDAVFGQSHGVYRSALMDSAI